MYTPRISQRFASKKKFALWCCDLATTHIGYLPQILSIFFQDTWHKPFLEGCEVIFLNNLYTRCNHFFVYRNDYFYLPVFESFSKFPRHLHTVLSQLCHSTCFLPSISSTIQVRFCVLQQLFRISVLLWQLYFGQCEDFLFPKIFVSHVSVGAALTGFNKS